jgi:hypothetical protein
MGCANAEMAVTLLTNVAQSFANIAAVNIRKPLMISRMRKVIPMFLIFGRRLVLRTLVALNAMIELPYVYRRLHLKLGVLHYTNHISILLLNNILLDLILPLNKS